MGFSPPLALCFLGLSSAAMAAPQELIVRNYTEADGLPNSRVYDVRVSPAGLPWFATRDGLHTYDGSAWTPVHSEALSRASGARCIRFDARERPWILSGDGRVAVLEQDGPHWLPNIPGLTGPKTLLEFEVLGSGSLVAVSHPTLGVWLFHDGRWTVFQTAAGFHEPIPIEPAYGCLYLGVGEELVVLDPAGQELRRLARPCAEGPIQSLYVDRDADGLETLFLAGASWIGTVGPGDEAALVTEGLFPWLATHGQHRPMVSDGNGNLLVGTYWTIERVELASGAVTRIGRAEGLVGDGVNAFARDTTGLVWGATDLGAFKLLGFDVRVYRERHGLGEDMVTALAAGIDGTLFIGHFDGITLLREGAPPELFRFEATDPALPYNDRVNDLHLDPEGVLWIAGSGRGLGRLAPGEALTWVPSPPGKEFWANTVHVDRDGSILVGTPAGLWRFADGRLSAVLDQGDQPHFVRRLEVCEDGRAYAASPFGLHVRQGSRWAPVPGEGLPEDAARGLFTVFEDSRGQVWAGGEHGLHQVRGDRLVEPPEAFRTARRVFSLTEDQRGRLWVGTDYGFLYSNGERLVSLAWMGALTGIESNRAAALCDPAGRVWLGTNHGLTVFEPGFELPRAAPRVEVVGLEVGRDPRALDGALRIESGRGDLTFRARAVTLLAEQDVEFRYRIEGFSAWETRRSATVLEARFTGLPPGTFRFSVMARAPGGEWSEVVSAPPFEVVGPFYTRPWFLALILVTTGLFSAGLYRLTSQRRRQRRLEAEIAQRTVELECSLQELAKTDRLRSLGLLAGGLAHDFRNILSVVAGNTSLLREQQGHLPDIGFSLDSIDQALARATQLTSQLQTFARGGAPTTRPLAIGTLARQCVNLILSGSRVAADFPPQDGLWPVEGDEAQLRQVLENLILNSRQMQPEGGWVRLRAANLDLMKGEAGAYGLEPGRYVQLRLEDGGPGISEEDRRHVFDPFFTTRETGLGLGLATARSIAQRHGGTLVNQPSEEGAVFELLLPVSAQALSEVELTPSPRPARGTGRVLVVDDQSEVRDMLQHMLAHLGYDVVLAGGARQAETSLRSALEEGRPFAFAIIDLTLPGDLHGPEILSRLLELDPRLCAAASSGYSNDPVLSRPNHYGFQCALPKPFGVGELATTMKVLARAAAAGQGVSPP